MKKRDVVAEYCADWVRWCQTRGFYMRKGAGSTLARLQPSKTGKEPNGRNYPDMQYFNMAVHTLAEWPQYAERYKAFDIYYNGDGKLAKVVAYELGIGLRTFYDRVKSFANAAYRLAPALKKAQEGMSTLAPTPEPPVELLPRPPNRKPRPPRLR